LNLRHRTVTGLLSCASRRYRHRTAAAIHLLTWGMSASRVRLARWWYQRERAWWRRFQPDQWSPWPGGLGRARAAVSRRLISGTVSGIMPGSGRGGLAGPGRRGGLGIGAVAEPGGGDGADGQAAMTSTVWRAIAM
jgi:hypothetical protein